ncbi:MAG TPA: hypothetical protein VFB72_06515, partial [Verrucomicrobiae bacterium]|nr:hypothetical protein [Verrucomicrobiae bacterium]
MKRELYLGRVALRPNKASVQGSKVTMVSKDFYCISNYDRMRPFLMSLVSSADHWMFVSSTGALTAGRGDADAALFPYYTEDKIHDSAQITGSKMVIIAQQDGKKFLWEPFSERYRGIYDIQRNLYKSFLGNELIFEETSKDLALTFRYSWANSERFGLIRKAALSSSRKTQVRIQLLDGIQNVLPSGLGSQLQLEKSVLVDAYKKNELLSETGLALFTLSSIIVDRPEPAESLKATTVWSLGFNDAIRLLSSVQLDRFRKGMPLREETDIRAERGAYFVAAEFTLHPGEQKDWTMAADVNQGSWRVAELEELLRKPGALAKLLDADIQRGTEELRRLVGSADGTQKTADTLGNARHFNNVLFNIMRGGVFRDGYIVDGRDLHDFVAHASHALARQHANFFQKLEKEITYFEMVRRVSQTGDANLERLCREYLPLTFSRRHGDASRPWNRFSIPGRNPDGSRILDYAGNWRDIFQNWEALAISFPGFVSGMICRFVNA